MLKTIKRTKQMRLDELIKYVWDNDIKNLTIKNLDGVLINFLDDGRFESEWCISQDDLFEVEIEEEITEDTNFEQGVVVFKYGSIHVFFKSNIKYFKRKFAGHQFKVYALIDEELELIYEVEDVD